MYPFLRVPVAVYSALEAAGAQEVSLRDVLYAVVLRLRGPWTAVQLGGFVAFFLALIAFAITWRKLK